MSKPLLHGSSLVAYRATSVEDFWDDQLDYYTIEEVDDCGNHRVEVGWCTLDFFDGAVHGVFTHQLEATCP